MSTDRSKKKKRVPRFERIKIIEYGCIGLVILLFLALAILYGKGDLHRSEPEAESVPSPVPTEDSSIRGKNVLDALEKGGFSVTYHSDGYEVSSGDGVRFTMQMLSDDRGIRTLSVDTAFCADPEEETTETAQRLRAENRKTTDALRALFDCIMPVFHRPVADSDTIVKQCRKVVESGETYSKHFDRYSLRITSDPDEIDQHVTVLLIRDS